MAVRKDSPLTLVDAPAGFGKSMLRAEWRLRSDQAGHCAWLSLDAVDNDLIIFWTYLVQALRRVAPDRLDRSATTLSMPGVSPTHAVIPIPINELWALDQSLTLILDDYHTITNLECHELLSFFLLAQTSILERFTPALCDAVTSTTGSAERLQDLEQANLFVISLDERVEWYPYHHLFRDLLQLELKQAQPDLLPVLHRRAAVWYRAAGDVIAAMHHAQAAGDLQIAGDLFFDTALSMLWSGRLPR